MPPKTRTRSSAPSKAAQGSEPSEHAKTLTPAPRPSKTFILPSAASDDARFVQLPDPRSGELTRYYFCPKLGVHEFTIVGSPAHQPRSILFSHGPGAKPEADGEDTTTSRGGFISKNAELLIATPIDLLFFMIPLLSSSGQKGLFQPLDDIIDSQDELPKHMRNILYNDAFRELIQTRTEAICDSVEAGDEKMFRFSESKLLKELIAKAERMVAHGMPVSLEERFIRQALVTPMMAVKREDPTTNGTPSNGTQDEEGSPEKQETETPATDQSSSTQTPSGEDTPVTEPTPDDPSTPDDVIHLLRISTALSLIKRSYLSQSLCEKLDSMLAAPESPVDFKPLNDRLKHIADLRAEALASRSLGDFSRKREADEDVAESRAEKKRRLEEDEKKKKANESRGVKDLKKVDTTGMKKMSDFFTRASAKKK